MFMQTQLVSKKRPCLTTVKIQPWWGEGRGGRRLQAGMHCFLVPAPVISMEYKRVECDTNTHGTYYTSSLVALSVTPEGHSPRIQIHNSSTIVNMSLHIHLVCSQIRTVV